MLILSKNFYIFLKASAPSRKIPGFSSPFELGPYLPHQCDLFESPFSEFEVWQALKYLGTNKSPGPDGFTAEFYKKILEHSQR